MSDSPNFDASVTDPQAHGRIPGRLRENVTDLQAHGRIPGRLQGNVAGGPDSSSAGVAPWRRRQMMKILDQLEGSEAVSLRPMLVLLGDLRC